MHLGSKAGTMTVILRLLHIFSLCRALCIPHQIDYTTLPLSLVTFSPHQGKLSLSKDETAAVVFQKACGTAMHKIFQHLVSA